LIKFTPPLLLLLNYPSSSLFIFLVVFDDFAILFLYTYIMYFFNVHPAIILSFAALEVPQETKNRANK
jgi:hypothetical protein